MAYDPIYYRARIAAIEQLITELPVERDEKNPDRVLLRNGFIPDTLNTRYKEVLDLHNKIQQSTENKAPLSLTELCSFNTWFAIYPGKIAGKETVTTSYEFPIAVKGRQDDIINAIRGNAGDGDKEKRIRLAKVKAEAKLKLLNLANLQGIHRQKDYLKHIYKASQCTDLQDCEHNINEVKKLIARFSNYNYRLFYKRLISLERRRDQLSILEGINSKALNNQYDHFIIAFSGGKDSLACLLYLLSLGVDKHKIELWHHLVDGREGSTLMDWPVTEDYCRKVAAAFNIPIFYSWKVNGFEGEMLRQNALTKPDKFEYPGENIIECGLVGGERGKIATRRKFPQLSADLKVRWCSAYLKIDVCTSAINNQPRFKNKRTIVISGERAEESPARAKYNEFEVDRADNRNGKSKRYVDHWRPVHKWKEAEVWAIIEKYKVNPHPAYRMGWGRLSCMFCIFGSANQWRSSQVVDQDGFIKISRYEKEFDVTIRRDKDIIKFSEKGKKFNGITAPLISEATKTGFDEPIIVSNWQLPSGAYGDAAGPI